MFALSVYTSNMTAHQASQLAEECEERGLEARTEYNWPAMDYYWTQAIAFRKHAAELDELEWNKLGPLTKY